MCGIFATTDPTIRSAQVQRALQALRHRGPDAPPGYLQHRDVQLGHTRLKILDLHDRSNQPFWSDDRRYVIVYNGEIYNFRELARQYDLPLHTASDTEVLLALYQRRGPAMLTELNGMFAFAILDTERHTLFIARDRLGVKPLYCWQRGPYITVASELAALLPLLDRVQYDDIGIRQYRKLRTGFNQRTIYQQIQMFPAGTYWQDGFHRYWQLPVGPQEPPSDEELLELLCSSVRYRCLADVPVGCFLSGGLDSTVLTALAQMPHSWSVGCPEANEFAYARRAAEHCGTQHTEVSVTPEEFVATATVMIQQRREPLAVPNEVLLYSLMRAVKPHNTVVLSGEGADELFFGYDRIFRWAASATQWDLATFSQLYAYGSHDDLEIVEDAVRPFYECGDSLQIVAAFFQVAHLHGLLRRLDNATMLGSVEGRVPFVDYRLVERLAGVGMAYRMADGVVKAPLKRLARPLIPAEIVDRQKVGFPVPLERMPFPPGTRGTTPMDRWIDFNLRTLEID